MRTTQAFEQRVQRVDSLVARLQDLPDEARRSAVDAVQALLELHGDVLERALELAGPEVSARMAEDPVVGGMLLVHGINPLPIEDRVRRALDGVRPLLGSHGGGVEVLGISEGTVRLRLEGSCHGCPSSTMTLKNAIERAIHEGVPDVERIEVDGVVPPPVSGFVPLASIKCPDGVA
jgi:Fe-S cluster biogenesis protein NfuA